MLRFDQRDSYWFFGRGIAKFRFEAVRIHSPTFPVQTNSYEHKLAPRTNWTILFITCSILLLSLLLLLVVVLLFLVVCSAFLPILAVSAAVAARVVDDLVAVDDVSVRHGLKGMDPPGFVLKRKGDSLDRQDMPNRHWKMRKILKPKLKVPWCTRWVFQEWGTGRIFFGPGQWSFLVRGDPTQESQMYQQRKDFNRCILCCWVLLAHILICPYISWLVMSSPRTSDRHVPGRRLQGMRPCNTYEWMNQSFWLHPTSILPMHAWIIVNN